MECLSVDEVMGVDAVLEIVRVLLLLLLGLWYGLENSPSLAPIPVRRQGPRTRQLFSCIVRGHGHLRVCVETPVWGLPRYWLRRTFFFFLLF